MLRADQAAEYFLWLACQEESDLISNLKLQKLLYYAQGYCLARLGRPLFDAQIVAWDHGPVVQDIYHEYKRYGNEALPCPGHLASKRYDDQERSIMQEVYNIYGQFSAWKLRNMAHEEPLWQNTKIGDVIPIGRLREYFLTRIQFRPVVVQTEVSGWEDVADEILEERHELWEKLARV